MLVTHNTDDERGERVEAEAIALGLFDCLANLSSNRAACEQPSNDSALESHSTHTTEPEHDGDTDMLHLLDSKRTSRRRSDSLHPCVGDTVEEDDERFDHFCRREDRVPLVRRTSIPSPSVFCKGAEISTKREETIPAKTR